MRKTAALILSFIIVLANTASLRSIELRPADLFGNVLAAEFSVLGFLTVSALPLRILNTVVAGDNTFCGQREQKPSRKPGNGKERNTASDPVIGSSPAELKTADSWQRTTACAAADAACPALFSGQVYPAQGAEGPPGFVFLSILVFLVILSLSNLPEGVLLFCRLSSRSRLIRTGIFLCGRCDER